MDYNAKHKAKNTIGICGINVIYWNDLLKDNGVSANSLKSCLVIYKELLNKHKNKRSAIMHYKGIESKVNFWIVDEVIRIENNSYNFINR